jgi:ATP-dependent protease ClpP protease subunit
MRIGLSAAEDAAISAVLRRAPRGAVAIGWHPNDGLPCLFDSQGRPFGDAPQPGKARARAVLNRTAKLINQDTAIVPLVPLLSLTGEVHGAMASRVEAFCREHAAAASINVLIDSRGGDYAAGKSIYAALRSHRGQVCVRVTGDCMSAAILPLLAADFAEALPSARFCEHCVGLVPSKGSNTATRWTADEHKRTAAELDAYDGEVARLLAGRTGLPESRFRALQREDRILSADEALGLRLIHAVIGRGPLVPKRPEPPKAAASGPGPAPPMRLGVPGGRTSF